jgi:hypothetical protein
MKASLSLIISCPEFVRATRLLEGGCLYSFGLISEREEGGGWMAYEIENVSEENSAPNGFWIGQMQKLISLLLY